jgi:hypothetical protein
VKAKSNPYNNGGGQTIPNTILVVDKSYHIHFWWQSTKHLHYWWWPNHITFTTGGSSTIPFPPLVAANLHCYTTGRGQTIPLTILVTAKPNSLHFRYRRPNHLHYYWWWPNHTTYTTGDGHTTYTSGGGQTIPLTVQCTLLVVAKPYFLIFTGQKKTVYTVHTLYKLQCTSKM